ncbi:cytochrome c [Phaeovulum sp.]|uniref:cytochrome c n=1 Tax=Phaeovulum sp. TaxID=2934796 RepID=UPI0035656794
MKTLRSFGFALLAVIAVFGFASAQRASNRVEEQIPERQALFRLLALYLEPIAAMGRGEVEYDSVVAEDAARNLAMVAQLDQTKLWPEVRKTGIARISLASVLGTAARSNALDDMTAAILRLAAVAGTGIEPMQMALTEVSQSCIECHETDPNLH